jgi:hypothetical protein
VGDAGVSQVDEMAHRRPDGIRTVGAHRGEW